MVAVAGLLLLSSILYSVTITTITGAASAGGEVGFCFAGKIELQPIANQTGYVGTRFEYPVNVTATCPSETMTFSGNATPDFDSYFINGSTGIMNFTPVSGEEGEYTINISVVKTGFDANSTTFTFTIQGSIHPENVTCSLNSSNSSRISMNWNDVSGASYYKVYYSTNISQVANLSSNTSLGSNVSVIFLNDSVWSDTTHLGVQRQYYTVSAVKNGQEGFSIEPACGKMTYYYDVPVSGTYGALASNRVTVYLNATYTAETFLQEIPGSLNPTISRLDKSNGSGEYYTTHVRGLNDGNNFNLEPVIAYQVTVDNYHNQTIVGKIYRPPYNVSYDAPFSSTYGTLATNFRGFYDNSKAYTAESFLQEIPADLNPTISRLDKSDGSGEFLTTHVRGLNDGNSFVMYPGVGYAVTVDSAYNHTFCVSCFR